MIINTDMFQAGSLYGRINGEYSLVHIYGYGTLSDNGWLANRPQPDAENISMDETGHSWENFVDAVLEWLDKKREENKKGNSGQTKSN